MNGSDRLAGEDPRLQARGLFRRLDAQLEVIRPRLLVPLGRHALKRFAPGLAIGEVHGHVVQHDGRTLFPMYHPAAALRNPRLRETLSEDARALRAALAL